jgi:hypothetical protein
MQNCFIVNEMFGEERNFLEEFYDFRMRENFLNLSSGKRAFRESFFSLENILPGTS